MSVLCSDRSQAALIFFFLGFDHVFFVPQETQKLAKEVGANMEETNKKLAPKVKEAYDDFVKQATEVQKKLHEAANKA